MKNILLISLLILINLNVAGAKTPTLLEPSDGRVYHGVQMMTFEDTKDPLAGYLKEIKGYEYIDEMKKPQYIHLNSKLTPDPFSATPLTEMGKSLYKDFAGGLYPETQNQLPIDHNNAGIELANTILPLDSEGLPDKNNGKIVLLSIGMSNTTQEFSKFINLMDTFQLKNSKLVIVDGAQGGQTASIIKDPNALFWKIIDTARLPQKNVTNKQVQAVWLKEANAGPTQEFPLHANMLKDDIEKIAQFLIQKYPNLKIVYLSSRIYGGYATTQLNPEPYAFESGFSVKWLIEEQINGKAELDYKATPKKAPWLAWGPYLWANGAKPREADGLVWLKEDFGNDGTHPSDLGRLKVAKMLLDFFRTDATSTPWFLEKEVSVQDNSDLYSISVFPNPAVNSITISKGSSNNLDNEFVEIQIYNTLGNCLLTFKSNQLTTQAIDISGLESGIFLVRFGNNTGIFIKR